MYMDAVLARWTLKHSQMSSLAESPPSAPGSPGSTGEVGTAAPGVQQQHNSQNGPRECRHLEGRVDSSACGIYQESWHLGI